MEVSRNKIVDMVKKVIFALALLICLLFGAFSSMPGQGELAMDLKSAVAVSIGFGTAVELIALSRKYS